MQSPPSAHSHQGAPLGSQSAAALNPAQSQRIVELLSNQNVQLGSQVLTRTLLFATTYFECNQFISDRYFQVKQLQKKNIGMERAMMDMKNEMAAERETFQREKEKWKIQMKKFQERYENERREFEKQRLLLQVSNLKLIYH